MTSGASAAGRSAAAIGRLAAFVAAFLAIGIVGQVGVGVLFPSWAESLLVSTATTAVAATLAGIALLRLLDGRPAGALGIAWTRRTPAELGMGLGLGIAAIAAAVAALAAVGFLRYAPEPGTWAGWTAAIGRDFAVFAVAAYAEEAMFRGYGYQALVRGFGAVPATLFASGAFALAHAGNPNVGTFALLNIFVAGVLLSAAYLRTLSLWFATAVHLGWNWGMASLLDLPVSGITLFETPLYEPVVRGPEWITGGAFGPEAGIIGTLAFGGALLTTLKWRAVAPDPAMQALRPLVEDRWVRP